MSRYNLYDTCTEFDKEDRDDSGESSGDEIKCIIQQGDGAGARAERETVSCDKDKTIWVHRYDRYNNKPITLCIPEFKTQHGVEYVTTTVHHIRRPVADSKVDNTVHNEKLVLDKNIITRRYNMLNRIGAITRYVINKFRQLMKI